MAFIILIVSLLSTTPYLINIQKNECEHKSFVPGEKWTDTEGVHINAHGGGVLYHEGIYYWYGEYKTSGKGGNTSLKGVSCYTSKDLYNWKNEGIVLKVEENPNSEIAIGSVMERPKVVFNKKMGKFVLWFHLELKNQGYNAAKTGVAISDNPTGPFIFQKSFRPNKQVWSIDFTEEQKASNKDDEQLKGWSSEWIEAVNNGMFARRDFEKGQMARDMTIFVDDDEKAYHIHASEENLTLHISELSDDYLGFTEKWMRVAPAGHNEAPAIFKQKGVYYMVTSGCTGWDPNEARSFKSTSIWGPWEPLGNPCVGKDADITFNAQSTFIIPVAGKKDAFIFMADCWKPQNPIDGTYVWLPIKFVDEKPAITWEDEWYLNVFKSNAVN